MTEMSSHMIAGSRVIFTGPFSKETKEHFLALKEKQIREHGLRGSCYEISRNEKGIEKGK